MPAQPISDNRRDGVLSQLGIIGEERRDKTRIVGAFDVQAMRQTCLHSSESNPKRSWTNDQRSLEMLLHFRTRL